MMEDQKKMMDPHRQEDSDQSSEDSDGEHIAKHPEYIFVSAIDVGSHFIDVNPSEELVFTQFEGNFFTQFTITNPCPSANIAFYVYTSAPIPVKIIPNAGFIEN